MRWTCRTGVEADVGDGVSSPSSTWTASQRGGWFEVHSLSIPPTPLCLFMTQLDMRERNLFQLVCVVAVNVNQIGLSDIIIYSYPPGCSSGVSLGTISLPSWRAPYTSLSSVLKQSSFAPLRSLPYSFLFSTIHKSLVSVGPVVVGMIGSGSGFGVDEIGRKEVEGWTVVLDKMQKRK